MSTTTITITKIRESIINGTIQELVKQFNQKKYSIEKVVNGKISSFFVLKAFYHKKNDLMVISGHYEGSRESKNYYYVLGKKKLEWEWLSFNPLDLSDKTEMKEIFQLILESPIDSQKENTLLVESYKKNEKLADLLLKTEKALKRLRKKTKNLNLTVLRKIRKDMLKENKINVFEKEISELYKELDDYKETSQKYKDLKEKISKLEIEKTKIENSIEFNNELELHEIDRKTSIENYRQARQARQARKEKINEYLNKRKTRKEKVEKKITSKKKN